MDFRLESIVFFELVFGDAEDEGFGVGDLLGFFLGVPELDVGFLDDVVDVVEIRAPTDDEF